MRIDKLEGKTIGRGKDKLDHGKRGAKGKALRHMKEGGQWKGNLDKAEKDK